MGVGGGEGVEGRAVEKRSEKDDDTRWLFFEALRRAAINVLTQEGRLWVRRVGQQLSE